MPGPFHPSLAEFRRLSRRGNVIPVWREALGDTLTPVSAFERLSPAGDCFLFESVVGVERIGRYSFLGFEPFASIRGDARETVVEGLGARRVFRRANPLEVLRDGLRAFRAASPEPVPLFCGGAVGALAYDAVRFVERLPNPPRDDRHLPDLAFSLYDRLVAFDHVRRVVRIVACASLTREGPDRAWRKACEAVEAAADRLARGREEALPALDLSARAEVRLSSGFSRPAFLRAVRRCKEYIAAGDIFQAVLSQRFTARTAADPFTTYRVLRVVNPSPYMFFLRAGGMTLVGSSPEVLVRVEGGKVTVRPIAGTRRRGTTPAEDARLAAELRADPKENAEHVMLVDLGRNDVGRVARFGSVAVTERMALERYSHVMHLTSNVEGMLRPGKGALDALLAGLPAGTVSGAPKIRAMEILDGLEPTRRGPYAGAVGYLDFAGNLDTCIAIRTILFREGEADVQAGAGIVADSVPEREFDETVNKAKALLEALRIAEAAARAGVPRTAR